MKKRLLSLLLVLALVFGVLPLSALAGDSEEKVRVIVENTTYTAETAPWSGTLVDTYVTLTEGCTMMSCVASALSAKNIPSVGTDGSYISSINGLAQRDGGSSAGWMGTLNDWFVNFGFAAFGYDDGKIVDGDVIRVMYTCDGGEDLGGSWNNSDKTVKALTASVGSIAPAFDKDTHSYTLTVPQGTTSLTVCPTASNKNFMVKTSVGGTTYRAQDAIPVSEGTVITVKCGDPSWPTMNTEAADVPAETYTLTVRIDKGNTAPKRAEGVAATAPAETALSVAYTLDLGTIFADEDGDTLSYLVSVNNGEFVAAAEDYSFSADAAGTYTLVFKANDGKTDSTETYTVTLRVTDPAGPGAPCELELSGIHDAQVKYLKLYSFNGEEKTGEDLLASVTPENSSYTLTVAAGDYWVEGYNAENECNGAVVLTVRTDAENRFEVKRVYEIYASNSGWVRDVDYRVDVTVSRGGVVRKSQTGVSTNWGNVRASCIFIVGDTVTATLTPIGERAEGYVPVTVSKTETMNTSISTSVPKGLMITIHAPAGSTIDVGTFGTYYIYKFVEAESVTSDDNGVTAVFRVPEAGSANHFYRVMNPDGVTYWQFAKWTAAAEITVTAEDLYIGSTDFVKSSILRYEKNTYDRADIYLNINGQGYMNMEVGGTFELNVFRNWMAIEGYMNAKVALPDMHYQVINPDGTPSDVLSIVPNEKNSSVAVMTANKPGTAIVLVTYDAMTHMQAQSSSSSKQFSAIWPECTGVFIVTVGNDGSSIELGMTLDRMDATFKDDTARAEAIRPDAEHDILFYVGSEGASYTFKPEAGTSVSVARSSVGAAMTFSGFTTEGVTTDGEGNVTVTGLTTGRHIVRVEKDGKANYQIITARGVTYEIQDKDGNPLPEGTLPKAGQTIRLQFNNLVSPKEKLSGVYNFNFSLYYQGEDGTYFRSDPGGNFGVYDFSGNPVRQVIEITIPKYWTGSSYDLTGAIKVAGFPGLPTHRMVTYANGAKMVGTAPNTSGVLAVLPELSIALGETKFLTGTLHFVDEKGNPVDCSDFTFTMKDDANNAVTVNSDGTFGCVAGVYDFTVRAAGYEYKTGSVTVTEDGENIFTVTLQSTSASAWDGVSVQEPKLDGDVYLISNGAELAWFVRKVNAKTAVSGRLTGDIELAKYPWIASLTSGGPCVRLDGAGYAIRDLNGDKGLFGALGANSEIRNLRVYGELAGGGAIATNVSGTGTVLENCANYATISGNSKNVGGLLGTASGVTLTNCANFALVGGNENVGGLVGNVSSNVVIRNGRNAAMISGVKFVGGLVGAVNGGFEMTASYNTGLVTGDQFVGGIAGDVCNSCVISDCYTLGDVSGTQNVGGAFGRFQGPSWGSGVASVSNCYAAGVVTCTGSNSGGFFAAFATDKVKAEKVFFLNTAFASDKIAEALTLAELRSADLSDAFAPVCGGFPALKWQTNVTFHTPSGEGRVTAPTCTEKGYTEYTCAKCRVSYRTDYKPADGHDFCDHAGIDETCPDCTFVRPGCTTDGKIVRTCRADGCTETKVDVLPATGHTEDEGKTVAHLTYKSCTCAVCGESYVVWNDPLFAGMDLPEDLIASITVNNGTPNWIYNAEKNRIESNSVGQDRTTASLTLTLTLAKDAQLRFVYGVSSENNYDKLTITAVVDGQTVTIANGISGERNAEFSLALKAGVEYSITFAYTKDSSSASGEDLGWFKELGFTKLVTHDEVETLIDAIGKVGFASGDAIAAARTAYDAASEEQQALVENYAKLTAAETLYATLLALREDVQSYDAATVTSDDKTDLEALLSRIDAVLTDELLADSARQTLEDYQTGLNAMLSRLADIAAAIAELTARVDEIDPETVTRDDLGTLYALYEQVNALRRENNLSGQDQAELAALLRRITDMMSLLTRVANTIEEVQNALGDMSIDTVTSADKDAILAFAAQIAQLTEGENLTAQQRALCQSIAAYAKQLVDRIDAVAAEIAAIAKACDRTEQNVSTDDAQSLAWAVEHVGVLLAGSNLTDDERASLEAYLETAQSLAKIVNALLDEIARIDAETTKLENKSLTAEDAAQIEALLADAEKLIPSVNLGASARTKLLLIKNRLNALAEVLEAKELIGKTYQDVSGHWAYDEIVEAIYRGLFNGVSETEFAPNEKVTRGMFVTVLWRAAGCPESTGELKFADVGEGAYYAEAVRWACEKGITNGVSATEFKPGMKITREQMATFLYRFVKAYDLNLPKVAEYTGYADAGKVSSYAAEAMQWAVEVGLLKGYEDGMLRPDALATRAEAAVIMIRFLDSATEN